MILDRTRIERSDSDQDRSNLTNRNLDHIFGPFSGVEPFLRNVELKNGNSRTSSDVPVLKPDDPHANDHSCESGLIVSFLVI